MTKTKDELRQLHSEAVGLLTDAERTLRNAMVKLREIELSGGASYGIVSPRMNHARSIVSNVIDDVIEIPPIHPSKE